MTSTFKDVNRQTKWLHFWAILYYCWPALRAWYALVADVSLSVICRPSTVVRPVIMSRGHPVKRSKQTPASSVINKCRRSHCVKNASDINRQFNSISIFGVLWPARHIVCHLGTSTTGEFPILYCLHREHCVNSGMRHQSDCRGRTTSHCCYCYCYWKFSRTVEGQLFIAVGIFLYILWNEIMNRPACPLPPLLRLRGPVSDSRHTTWRRWRGWGWQGRTSPWRLRWWRTACVVDRWRVSPSHINITQPRTVLDRKKSGALPPSSEFINTVRIGIPLTHKTLSHSGEAARCVMSLKISLNHWRSLMVIQNDALE